MKKIIFGASIACALLLSVSVAGCDKEYITYTGPDYIMFSDTLSVLPVQNNEEYFDIPVSATRAAGVDRTLAVEIVDKESNAIEGKHYVLESNSVTIKAGELATNVRVRGIADNIAISDSLGFTLRLVTEESTHWDIYGTDTKVILQKTCPFDINQFTGYCVVVSTYIMNYMTTDMRLIRSEVDPENENTIIMKDYFYDGYDLRIKFTTDDILNPLIEMEDQPFALTGEAFGTIYGDGEIWAYQPSNYTSYYSSCERFIFQYMTLHVPGMAAGYDTVGTFVNAVEWISDDEAEKLKREGY
ncbi:MAG: DUF4984 domain-containing protein [Bacteroides sp.]|nr:DUF4984 domain-containing protein [Bacteroides sp.]